MTCGRCGSSGYGWIWTGSGYVACKTCNPRKLHPPERSEPPVAYIPVEEWQHRLQDDRK